MSSENGEVGNPRTVVDIAEWIERSRSDPQTYLERQATEVFLTALRLTPSYGSSIYLKGGTLMGIRYGSPRQTADLDFTTSLDPDPNEISSIRAELDETFRLAAARIGNPDLLCKVQSIKQRPSEAVFPTASYPALELRIGYALRGSRAADRLFDGRCPTVLKADISYREPVDDLEIIWLGDQGADIRAYSLIDLMAEKLRALLQQEVRNRYRRQDVYDLAFLIERFEFDVDERERLLRVLREKCESRNIKPDIGSISRPEIVKRARSEWNTLGLELSEIPEFDERFDIVHGFYRRLPW